MDNAWKVSWEAELDELNVQVSIENENKARFLLGNASINWLIWRHGTCLDVGGAALFTF